MDEKRIFLARHAETHHNAAARSESYEDADRLSERGWRQARRLGEVLDGRGVSGIVSSPLERARESAEAVAETLHAPIHVDDRLHEIVPPSAEDLSGEAEAEHWSGYMARRADDRGYSVGGAESFDAVMGRVRGVVESFDHHGCALFVSHAGFLRFLMGYITWGDDFSPLTLPRLWIFEVHNAGMSELRHMHERPGYRESEGWSIVTWMKRDHLEGI